MKAEAVAAADRLSALRAAMLECERCAALVKCRTLRRRPHGNTIQRRPFG
jgi:hypothetical protein